MNLAELDLARDAELRQLPEGWVLGVNCAEGDLEVYHDELAGETWECEPRGAGNDGLSAWWRSWDVEEAYARDWAATYTGRPPGEADEAR